MADTMADNEDAQDPEAPAVVPAPAPTYTTTQSGQDCRQRVRQQGLEERAQWCRDLIALAPLDQQSEAMVLILRLEQAHAREEDALRHSWLQEVQLAYVTGRAEVATEDLERVTGEPASVTGEPPARLH